MSRVPVKDLRAAVDASGMSLLDVARGAGMTRVRRNRPRPFVDTSRLCRSLGITSTSDGHFNRTIDDELARRICTAIGRDFDDVFAVALGAVCRECGEELVGSPDGLCGFCREERALAGVAA